MSEEFAPRISGLVLYSQQVENTRAFYEQMLCLQFQRHTDHGPAHYAASFGNFLLEIYDTNKKELPIDKLLIEVSSLERILARVHSSHIMKPSILTEYGKLVIIQDPDGRKILLLQKDTNI